MADLGKPHPVRSAALLAAAVAALIGTTHLAHPRPPSRDFEGALTWAAAWTLTGCAAWAVLGALSLVVAALRGPDLLRWCCPAAWRPAMLAAAGAAVALGAVTPAHADGWRAPGLARPVDGPVDGPVGGGVDRPARHATHPGAHPGAQAGPPADAVVVVRAGDSLWRLVADRHPGADDATVAALVAAAYRTNRATIGADPDLLRPGQQLRLPEERSPR